MRPSCFLAPHPQRFHRTAETKCIHCFGTEYRRPFASLQVYGGDLFGQADQALEFVQGKINRAIGTRAAGITAPATYELPPTPSVRPSSTPSPIATTSATPPSKCASFRTVSKSGTPEDCRTR